MGTNLEEAWGVFVILHMYCEDHIFVCVELEFRVSCKTERES